MTIGVQPVDGSKSDFAFRRLTSPALEYGEAMAAQREATNKLCAHCGTSASEAIFDEHGHVFCCNGCFAAFELIQGEGLNEYYRLRGLWDSTPRPVGESMPESQLLAWDDPRFLERFATRLSNGNWLLTFNLVGIHCAACVWLLEKLPSILPGVATARASLARCALQVSWDGSLVSVGQIARILVQLGYTPTVASSSTKRSAARLRNREQLVRIAIAGACAGNVMLLALGMYAGEASGMAAQHLALLQGTSVVIGLACLLGPGAAFFRGAWAAMKSRTPHMDVPIALGLGVGATSGAINGVMGVGELYFDSLCMLVFLLLVGRQIQSSQQQSSCEAVDILRSIVPQSARRIVNGMIEFVMADSLVPGDTIEILPSEIVPADGKVVAGSSEVDQAWLTGESVPVAVEAGDTIAAGTLNIGRSLRMVVERVGEDTRAGKIAKSIQDLTFAKSPLIQLADRIAGYFVVVVIVLALFTACAWSIIDARAMPDRVISLLIVACPCALGLATPLVVARVMSLAARREMLIKGADVLHRLVHPGIVWFDKTGTITYGEHQVVGYSLDESTFQAVAQLESITRHPIGRAIVRKAKLLGYEVTENSLAASSKLDHARVVPGGGVIGTYGSQELVVGNQRLVESMGCRGAESVAAELLEPIQKGQTAVLVAVGGRVVGHIALQDRLRDEACRVMHALRDTGWQVGLLSGDHCRVVESIGKQLGIAIENCRGGMTPEGKQAIISECRSVNKAAGGTVVMVGDGVNDAGALASADVGIAVAGGAEACMEAADVYLRSGELTGIIDLMAASRNTRQIALRNFFASLGYNLVAVALAMMGWIHPLIAAILMPISSLTVVLVTMSAKFFK